MNSPPSITSKEVADAARKMRAHFLVPFELEPLLQPVAELARQASEQFKQPMDAFCSALQATKSTTCLPYFLASSKASALHFQRFHMAERIRNIPISDAPEQQITKDEAERLAYKSAREKFKLFQTSEDGVNAIVGDISNTLLRALEDPATSNASKELLYQGLVSLWSAFEVLVRDVLIALLNSRPELSERLLRDVTAKKYFDLQKISIEDLTCSGFDLSNRMGDLLLGSRDFSDIRAIKAAAIAVLPGADTAEALNNKLLWQLNQDRHLIVHRRGIVDAKYKQNTASECALGSSIAVSPISLEKYLEAVIAGAHKICIGVITQENPTL